MPRHTRLSFLFLLMLVAANAFGGLGTWTTNGPYGGRITSIAVDPNDPSTLFVGTHGPFFLSPYGGSPLHGGGVFKSINGGGQWTPINNGLPTRDVLYVVAVDDGSAAHRTVVYAGTADGGVFQSDTGGLTWVARNGGLPTLTAPNLFNGLAVAPTDYLTLYASIFGEVWATRNGGISWTRTSPSLPNARSIAVDPMDPNVAYVTNSAEISFTQDGGSTWKKVACGLPPSLFIHTLKASSNFPYLLYAGTDSGVFALPLAHSGCWSAVASLPATAYRIVESQLYPPYQMFAASNNAVYTSSGGGAWAPAGAFPTAISALCPDPRNKLPFLASGDDGFFADNGGGISWAPQNDGLSAHYVASVAVSPTNARVAFATSGKGLHKTIDGGLTWTEVLNHATTLVYIDPSNPDVVYAHTEATPVTWFGFKKTIDGGATWSFHHYSLVALVEKIYNLAIHPNHPSTIYAGTDNGVWKSTNGGITWSPVHYWYYTNFSFMIRALVIDPVDPDIVYTTDGSHIWRSADGGVTWSQSLAPVYTTSLAIRPDRRALYAGTDDGSIYASTDQGATWILLSTGFGATVTSLVIDQRKQDVLYAGTLGAGVFQSTDRGRTWTPMNAGDPNPNVNQLALSRSGAVLYAATTGSVYEFEHVIPPSEGR